MQILDLNRFRLGHQFDADLVIVGGGPAGLTIARELFLQRIQVIVVESGALHETARISALNKVERGGTPVTDLDVQRRTDAHKSWADFWSHADQPYGVRCRVFGGSSHAWAGKSAAFDDIDFAERSWVPYSGWPISQIELAPYLARAADQLNLGPNVSSDLLWSIIGCEPPGPHIDPQVLKSFFWQFARSRIDQFQAMRFGPEFIREQAPNVRVLINATVTEVETDETGSTFRSVTIKSQDGAHAHVRGRAAVLAASALENPRLLLVSARFHKRGLGNANDVVGRYLLDHPAAAIASFDKNAAPQVVKRFGFQGVLHRGRMHMFMHGLALPASVQRDEGLLNCALYMLERHAPDDPFLAFKRIVQGNSLDLASDLFCMLKSPAPVLKGIGIKAFQSKNIPEGLKHVLIDILIKSNPNFAVRELLHRGVQYRLLGIRVEGITEQCPDPESRLTLSHAKDELGVPLARIHWKVDTLARRSLARLGQLFSSEMSRGGLPVPTLESWIAEGQWAEAPVIDMAHTMGTTRMSTNPRQGVVDKDCRVHGMHNLFIAGGSIFPTGGHSNPTLMIVAMAIRLADKIKETTSHWPTS